MSSTNPLNSATVALSWLYSGIVNDLADRTLAAFDERHDAIDALQQSVNVLQRALAGAHHVLDLGLVAGL
jgi:hypothetical protein